jgi:hypothetical protein
MFMNDKSDDLEPLNVEKLMAQFSDFTIAELVLEIKELREALEQEKKVSAAKEFKCQKAELELEELTTRINTARANLRGDVVLPEETE